MGDLPIKGLGVPSRRKISRQAGGQQEKLT
jgi:hypothetical protein